MYNNSRKNVTWREEQQGRTLLVNMLFLNLKKKKKKIRNDTYLIFKNYFVLHPVDWTEMISLITSHAYYNHTYSTNSKINKISYF